MNSLVQRHSSQKLRLVRWRQRHSPLSIVRCVSSQSMERLPERASASEVEKFTAMSSTWWDPTKNPLISMNVIRMQFIQKSLQHHLATSSDAANTSSKDCWNGIRALDIGCGGGLLSESLTRLGATVEGIDPSQSLIQAAREHATATLRPHELDRLHYMAGVTVEQFAQEKERADKRQQYDVICCLEVIEHVPDPASLLQSACSLLKPNGLLFVSTINQTAKSWALTIVGAEYLMRYLPVGTHQWESYRSPQEVQQMLVNTNGTESVRQIGIAGMVLAPSSLPALALSNKWQWELDSMDTDVNWIACYRKHSAVV